MDALKEDYARAVTGPMPNRVRELRKERRMTQAQLAHKAQVALRTIHSVEKGMPCGIKTECKILQALDLDIEQRDQVFSPRVTQPVPQVPDIYGAFSVATKSIKDARLRKGWTQKDLEERSGVCVRIIPGIEKGNPCSQSTQDKLMRALDIPESERDAYFMRAFIPE